MNISRGYYNTRNTIDAWNEGTGETWPCLHCHPMKMTRTNKKKTVFPEESSESKPVEDRMIHHLYTL